jgi:hypothetical protein
MAFVVWLDTRDETDVHGGTPYEDEDSYQFLHDGVLKITIKADKSTRFYAPGVWRSVETKNEHQPTLTSRWAVNMSRLPGVRW